MSNVGVVTTVVAALVVGCGDGPAPVPVPPAAAVPSPVVERGATPGIDPSSQPAAPESLDDGIAGRFVEAVSGSFRATLRAADEPYPLSAGGAVPVRIRAWSFVEHGAPPPESGVRLRFSLRVFEFGSVGAAADALADLAAAAAGTDLLKAPLLAVRSGSSVVRLDGACTFSRERWMEIQDTLLRALPQTSRATSTGALEVQCGGSVVRAPESPSPGDEVRQDATEDGVEQ